MCKVKKVYTAKGLPRLAEAVPDFAGFEPGRSRSLQIREHLIVLARTLRQRQLTPFYSMPDIAGFFGVTVTTVARLYRTLEAEGLLQLKRGATTMVCPRQSRPRAHLRGVVAIPIWMPGFLRFAERRLFHRELDEQLRRHRFVSDQLFFHQNEENQPGFVDRVLDHQPDAVVWLMPSPGDWETILSIRDAGVPVIILANHPTMATEAYQLSQRQALEQGLTAWRRDGIRTAIIPGLEAEATGAHFDLSMVAASIGMRILYSNPLPGSDRDDLVLLAHDAKTGVLFGNDIWCHFLCRKHPADIIALLRRTRTMTTIALDIEPTSLAGLFMDDVRFPWAKMAARIARDLATGPICHPRTPVLFEATWHPRVPAADHSAHFFAE